MFTVREADLDEPADCAGIVAVLNPTKHARPLLNIHDLAVVPEWRGKGIGRALLEAAEASAVRRGCCKLTLEVLDDNQSARALYDRYGFVDFVIVESAPTRFLCKPLLRA